MRQTKIEIPSPGLVVLSGAPGTGKTTFARKHFKPSEVLSSDAFRAAVDDDEGSTRASADAFWLMHETARRRLRHRRLAVIDATTASREAREGLRALATECHAQMSAIVFDLPIEVALKRNAARERIVPERALRRLHRLAHTGAKHLRKMTRGHTTVLASAEAMDAATVERVALRCDHRDDRGPFDIVGDVHGCFDELRTLVARLGYAVTEEDGCWRAAHPEGRKLVFVGDLVDRGPKSLESLRFAREAAAYVVEGNHEAKLRRALRGQAVKRTHGLEQTMEEVESGSEEARTRAQTNVQGMPSHVVLDDGRLVVAHAGLPEAMHLGVGGKVSAFAKYGETDGESDVYGLPVRHQWAERYEGRAAVVYGHTVVPKAEWIGNTLCVDTGCVFGGALSALRWPEREIVSVPAERTYYAPVRPIEPPEAHATRGLVRLEDVTGTQRVETRAMGSLRIDAGRIASAVYVATRFALPAEWLAYIPATMAPCEAAREGPLLERPEEAFEEFHARGVNEVVCELKHMGSRAIMIAGRDEDALERVFGVRARGTVYTRTGRRFFDDAADEAAIIDAVRAGMEQADLWSALGTDWIMLDGELVPWVVKARALVNEHYDVPARAGLAALDAALAATRTAKGRVTETKEATEALRAGAAALEASLVERREALARFEAVVKDYQGREGVARYAPFCILAGEGNVWAQSDRMWQMTTLAALCAAHPTLVETPWRCVDTERRASARERPHMVGEPHVGGGARGGNRGQATQAREHAREGAWSRAARAQGSGTRVPAHHLRPRLHPRRAPRPTAQARHRGKARARCARARAGARRTAPARRGRAAAPALRVRARSARTRERAGRPAPLKKPATCERLRGVARKTPTRGGDRRQAKRARARVHAGRGEEALGETCHRASAE